MKLAAILFLFLASPLVATVSQTEIVAALIIGEAGGEYATGAMEAVHEVLCLRAKRRGSSLRQEALRPKQFSFFNDKTPQEAVARAKKHPRWDRAYIIATNPPSNYTLGADHYYSTKMMKAPPYWARSMVKTAVVGNHDFYRSR